MKFSLTRTMELIEKKGMSVRGLERALGFGNKTISKWEEHIPSVDKVVMVADYFNVSVDYLLGRAAKSIVYVPEAFQELDAENRQKAMEYIDFLLMKQAEKKSDKVGV